MRILLFLAVNIAVIITISIIMRVFGIEPYLSQAGLNYNSLAIFCFIFGMLGAGFSLLTSKWMAKRFMGLDIIDERTSNPELRFIVDEVHRLAKKANLPAMPEVGVFDSEDVNAFATGPSSRNSLVAVSTGLLDQMSDQEVTGVLAHEIAHIQNGDMITMALLQGIINAFVMFAARAVAWSIMTASGEEEGGTFSFFGYIIVVFLLEMVFMVFGSLIIMGFSRWREYRADAGGAELAGRDYMLSALQRLKETAHLQEEAQAAHPSFRSMQISNKGGFLKLFHSHPDLDKRIARLQGFKS